MFRSLTEPNGRLVTVSLDGRSVELPEGDNLAVALLRAGHGPFRTTPVKAAPRMPYCMMGVCFECLAEIDGVPNRQTCQERVVPGQSIRRQDGARSTGSAVPPAPAARGTP
jgi:predicted molibdopterin-dependent oxidoreductase YjgC